MASLSCKGLGWSTCTTETEPLSPVVSAQSFSWKQSKLAAWWEGEISIVAWMVWNSGREYKITDIQIFLPSAPLWTQMESHHMYKFSKKLFQDKCSVFNYFLCSGKELWQPLDIKTCRGIKKNSWQFCTVEKIESSFDTMELLSHHKTNFCFLSNECLILLDLRIRANEALHEQIQNTQYFRQYWIICCQSIGRDYNAW